jgi:hypothetical protein
MTWRGNASFALAVSQRKASQSRSADFAAIDHASVAHRRLERFLEFEACPQTWRSAAEGDNTCTGIPAMSVV